MRKTTNTLFVILSTICCCFSQEPATGFETLPTLQWKFQTRGAIVASPVVSGGVAFVGSADSVLYAIDLKTGKTRWTFRTGGAIKSAVCMEGKQVFLSGGDGTVYALEKSTGTVLWTFRTAGERLYPLYGYADYYHSSPVLSDGVLYVGSGDSCLYALRPADGALVWKFKTGDVVHATPVVWGDKIFIGSFDGWFYALNRRTGDLIWKFKSVGQRFFPKGEFQGSPVAGGGLVFVGSRDYNLYALDVEKGYCHWNKQFPKGWALALSFRDSVLYVGTSDDDVMIAMDAATGRERWRTNVQFNIFGPAAVENAMLYFGTLMGKFYGLDQKTGEIRWTFKTDGYQANHAKYFPDENTIVKDDFYGRVQTPEGYIAALYQLGAVFSSPAILDNWLIFSSTDGVVYGLRK